MTADPKRWARQNMQGLSNEESRALLLEFDNEVAMAVQHAHPNDRDDYAAVGRVAILDAAITHDPRRMLLRSWVRKVVRQRVHEFGRHMRDQREDHVLCDNIEDDTDIPRIHFTPSPEDQAIAADSQAAVRRELSFLEPRNQVLLSAELEGESTATTARSLGISKQRAYEIRTESISCLRIFLHEAE